MKKYAQNRSSSSKAAPRKTSQQRRTAAKGLANQVAYETRQNAKREAMIEKLAAQKKRTALRAKKRAGKAKIGDGNRRLHKETGAKAGIFSSGDGTGRDR